MKLRNKKTGEIVDVESLGHAESLKEKYGYQVTLSWKTKYENLSQCKSYESLAELNEDWEDYKSAEPLIKDEKIRKAVRAWAEANDIDSCFYGDKKVKFNSSEHRFTWIDTSIEFDEIIGLENLKNRGRYTIAELCGEEEAPEPIEPTFIDLDERIKEKEE